MSERRKKDSARFASPSERLKESLSAKVAVSGQFATSRAGGSVSVAKTVARPEVKFRLSKEGAEGFRRLRLTYPGMSIDWSLNRMLAHANYKVAPFVVRLPMWAAECWEIEAEKRGVDILDLMEKALIETVKKG